MWTLVDVQTNNGGLIAHVQWFSCQKMEQTIMASVCDVMRISHVRKGRELYKESMTEPWGCCYCHLGVPVQSIWGLLTSHRPSTSAVSVLFEEEA